jgi:transcriptional regulator with XRE-family HTH domain
VSGYQTTGARSAYEVALGTRLRAFRAARGLSLAGVEERSGGRWKAVAVGSYERGDRSVTVVKLAGLAEFYGIPVADMLPDVPVTAS